MLRNGSGLPDSCYQPECHVVAAACAAVGQFRRQTLVHRPGLSPACDWSLTVVPSDQRPTGNAATKTTKLRISWMPRLLSRRCCRYADSDVAATGAADQANYCSSLKTVNLNSNCIFNKSEMTNWASYCTVCIEYKGSSQNRKRCLSGSQNRNRCLSGSQNRNRCLSGSEIFPDPVSATFFHMKLLSKTYFLNPPPPPVFQVLRFTAY